LLFVVLEGTTFASLPQRGVLQESISTNPNRCVKTKKDFLVMFPHNPQLESTVPRVQEIKNSNRVRFAPHTLSITGGPDRLDWNRLAPDNWSWQKPV